MANQRDKSVQEEETSQQFSKEELFSEISELVSKQINSAITQRNNAFEKKIESLLSKVVPQTQEDEVEGTQKTKPGRVPNAEILSMKQKLDQIQAERDAEVNKRRDNDLRNNLREQLTKAGVAPHLIKAAVATLVSEDKLVSYTSDEYAPDKDRMVFKSKSGEEDLSVGLGKWIRSDEGSSFLSPRGAQGSGDKSYNTNKSIPKQTLTDAGLAEMLIAARG